MKAALMSIPDDQDQMEQLALKALNAEHLPYFNVGNGDCELSDDAASYWLASAEWEPFDMAYLFMNLDPRAVLSDRLLRQHLPPFSDLAKTILDDFRHFLGWKEAARLGIPRDWHAPPADPPAKYPAPSEWLALAERIRLPIPDKLKPGIPSTTADTRSAKSKPNGEPDPRHLKTLLLIIGALLDLAEVDPDEPPKTTAHHLNAKLVLKEMKPDTIAEVLKAAKKLRQD